MKIKEFLIKEASEDEMWKELAKLLRSHDWMYSMSSDYKAYQKGQKEDDKILELRQKLREIDKQKLIKLYKDNVPRNVLNIFAKNWEKEI